MNTKYRGDSHDLVKRFFTRELADLGYQVVADPMFTGSWSDKEKARFFGLVQATPQRNSVTSRAALFLDPDIGIHERQSLQPTTTRHSKIA